MDKLIEQSCQDFSAALASKESVPGGGGAAALVGALGVALCSMAGNFTVGKKKYAEVEEDVQRIIAKADTLRMRLLALVDADAYAFAPLSEAYKLPKDNPARVEILETATRNACRAPCDMVSLCCQAIDLLGEILDKCSVMLISDVGCGALLCKAALESAAMNVFINTKSLKNREEAQKIEMEIERLTEKYVPMAQSIADQTMHRIRTSR